MSLIVVSMYSLEMFLLNCFKLLLVCTELPEKKFFKLTFFLVIKKENSVEKLISAIKLGIQFIVSVLIKVLLQTQH